MAQSSISANAHDASLPQVRDGFVGIAETRALLRACRSRTLFVGDITRMHAARWRAQLESLREIAAEPVIVVFDSSGGSADSGRALGATLQNLDLPTVGIVVGRAYSAACEMLQGCRLRIATPHARLLVHHATGEIRLTVRAGSDHSWIADVVEAKQRAANASAVATIERIVARTSLDAAAATALMQTDEVLSAQRALAIGLIDAVIDPTPAAGSPL